MKRDHLIDTKLVYDNFLNKIISIPWLSCAEIIYTHPHPHNTRNQVHTIAPNKVN